MPRLACFGLTTLILVLAPSVRAQEPSTAQARAAEAPSAVDPAQLEDASIDRALFFPTAMTQPRGSVVVNNYEVFLAGLSYGLTDRLELSLTSMLVTFDDARAALASAKYQLPRQGRLRLALFGGLIYRRGPKSDPNGIPHHARPQHHVDFDNDLAAQAGGTVSLCLSDDCHSLASAGLVTGVPLGTRPHQLPLMYSASFVGKLARHLKLVVELTQTVLLDRSPSLELPMLAAALRIFSSNLALDLGVIGLPEDRGGDLAGFFPLPYVSACVRF